MSEENQGSLSLEIGLKENPGDSNRTYKNRASSCWGGSVSKFLAVQTQRPEFDQLDPGLK